MLTVTVTYQVLYRRRGTGNSWGIWRDNIPSLHKALKEVEECIASHSECKLKEVSVVG